MIISPINSRLRLLITGGKGQVASAMKSHLLSADYSLTFCSHEELNIQHQEAILQAIKHHQPDFIINTAAYTKVDQAEINQDVCLQANFEGCKQLALACQKNRIPLIHLSTDYIFDGKAAIPYLENHPANPLQIYGQSKWLGEEMIRQTCEQFIILRVSGIFSEHGQNFVKTMLRLGKEKPELSVVSDQFTCPTYALDIATAIFTLIKNYKETADTLHFCSHPVVSWYEFAKAIFNCQFEVHPSRMNEIPNKIQPISTAEYPTLAKRPLYSVLNCERIQNNYGVTIPDWKVGLQKTIEALKETK